MEFLEEYSEFLEFMEYVNNYCKEVNKQVGFNLHRADFELRIFYSTCSEGQQNESIQERGFEISYSCTFFFGSELCKGKTIKEALNKCKEAVLPQIEKDKEIPPAQKVINRALSFDLMI